MTQATNLAPLRAFVTGLAALVEDARDERDLLVRGAHLLGTLVATEDWLPEAFAQPDPTRYCQYLLHLDPAQRFSIVSFVWGPGQATPIHDHRVWGLVGVLRGAELVQGFARDAEGALRATADPHILSAGQVEPIAPSLGDIHRVANAHDDRVSISIHVYGGDIGTIERATYAPDGSSKRFVSGYANSPFLDPKDLSA